MNVVEDTNHPELSRSRTDPAELAWHLYRHHGLDLPRLTTIDIPTLWELHEQHHAGD